jgi:hypothetical protein
MDYCVFLKLKIYYYIYKKNTGIQEYRNAGTA